MDRNTCADRIGFRPVVSLLSCLAQRAITQLSFLQSKTYKNHFNMGCRENLLPIGMGQYLRQATSKPVLSACGARLFTTSLVRQASVLFAVLNIGRL